MRREEFPARKPEAPEVIQAGAEQEVVLKRLTQYGQALSEATIRANNAYDAEYRRAISDATLRAESAAEKAYDKAWIGVLGTDPQSVAIDLKQARPTETNTGRGYTPEQDTVTARAEAAVTEAQAKLKRANGKLIRICTFASALMLGGIYMAPAARRIGEVQGAIDALSNNPSDRDSLGRLVRNVAGVAKEAADVVSEQIEERILDTAEAEPTDASPESSPLARQRAFNDRIKVHADEFAKELFHQWIAETGKDGRHHRNMATFFSTDTIATLAKQHPDFEQFRRADTSVSLATQRLILERANTAATTYLTNSFRQLRSGSRLQDVQRILDRVGWSNDSARGTASAMLIESGRTNLGMQLLRQTIRNYRTDEDGKLLPLDSEADSTEDRESISVGARISDEILTPFFEHNPESILQAIEGRGRSSRLRLTREEMGLLLHTAADLAADTQLDANLADRDRRALPTESSKASDTSVETIARINLGNAANRDADRFEIAYQRLRMMADPQTRTTHDGGTDWS